MKDRFVETRIDTEKGVRTAYFNVSNITKIWTRVENELHVTTTDGLDYTVIDPDLPRLLEMLTQKAPQTTQSSGAREDDKRIQLGS
jgi:hypothetical protein